MYDAWLDRHIDYHDPDEKEDEWTESAANEPDADLEWAQALTDETEDEQC